MIVAGVMSGTSADGVDVALCRIAAGPMPRIKLLGQAAFPYPPAVRKAVLAAMDAQSISFAELSRLHWRLGALYADCIHKSAQLAWLTWHRQPGNRPATIGASRPVILGKITYV